MGRPTCAGLLIASILGLAACRGDAATHGTTPAEAAGGPPPGDTGLASLGEGFAVWESNRSGSWRIWLRRFGDTDARPLSRDRAGRAHCCPHIAPDGQKIVYLSLPAGGERYPSGGAVGVLRLQGLDGSDARVVANEARTYFEHRAAVWHDNDTIVFIDGTGATRSLDLATGAEHALVPPQADAARGWLIDPTLRHGTTGSPGFARFEAATARLIAGAPLAGCQPYFTHDGRFGFWVAGAGGPIRRIDLSSGETRTVLGKSDPRLPKDRGYLYFPMTSPDSRLIAWAASDGAHDHQRSDYDVFVAPIDPGSLALVGAPVRVTSDAATDRFPDVFLAPLALGWHQGEAPVTIAFEAPLQGDWSWQLGDGTEAKGPQIAHTFTRIGTYRVSAALGPRLEHGTVRIVPAAPPRLVRSAVVGGRDVTLLFDEPIALDGLAVSFASGRKIAGYRLGEDGRSLVVTLAGELEAHDVLHLAGVTDRAQHPNRLEPVEIDVARPVWPADRDGLVLLWQAAAGDNRVIEPESLGERRAVFEPSGRAFTDRHGGMVLAGGHFLADLPTMEGLLTGCRATNALTLEATITPAADARPRIGRIVTFSGGLGLRNLSLSQRGDDLVLQINTPETGKNAQPGLTLGALPRGRPSHVVIGYEPGRVVYYRDGSLEREVQVATGGFFHWRALPLLVGNEWHADVAWHGRLEGLAVYDRVLGAAEAAENARRYRHLRAERPAAESLIVRAELIARSTVPTLEEIAPYRDALAVFAYRVEQVHKGRYEPSEIRVVHRVWLDGERLEAADRKEGERLDLRLERFADHPELESLYRSETLPARYHLPLFFSRAAG